MFFIWVSIQLKITVKLSRSNQKKEFNFKSGSTVQELLQQINLKPDTVIVMNKEKPVPIDEILVDGQSLTIIQVSSGG